MKFLTEPFRAVRHWLYKKLATRMWPGEIPPPRNPGVHLGAFDWCCEQSRFSTVGEGEDTTVYWTVIYRGEYKNG